MQSELLDHIKIYISLDHNPNHHNSRWQRPLPAEKENFASPTVPELARRQKRFHKDKDRLFDRRIVTVSSYKGCR
jgi:hypothetical protein